MPTHSLHFPSLPIKDKIRSTFVESIISFTVIIHQYVISIYDYGKKSCKGTVKVHTTIMLKIVDLKSSCNHCYHNLEN